MTPYQEAGFNELTLFRLSAGGGDVLWVKGFLDTPPVLFESRAGVSWHELCLLEELPKDADGFYLWEGGECPVPGDWVVEVKTRQEPSYVRKPRISSEWYWRIIGGGGDITAFKPISRPDMPRHSEAVDTAESPVVVEDKGDILAYTPSALDVQEGGDHYKKLKIQPMEYSMANKLDACQHTIIKYVTRFRDKGGIEDLRKAKHCIDMLIEFETKE